MRHPPGGTLRNNFTNHAAEGARIKTFRENGSIFPDSVKTLQDDAPFFRYAPPTYAAFAVFTATCAPSLL